MELDPIRRIQFIRKPESLKGEQEDLFNDAVVTGIGNLH